MAHINNRRWDVVPFLSLSRLSFEPRSNHNIEHCYPTLRICTIIQGRGQWRIGRKEYPVRTGDAFLFNNIETRALHTIIPPDPLQMLVLEFEPRFIWVNGFNVFDSSILSTFFNRTDQFEHRIAYKTPMSRIIQEGILEIQQEYFAKQPKYEELVKLKTLSLLTLLNRHYFNAINPDPAVHHGNVETLNLINQAMEYIDQHISEDLSLNKLAALSHMNPSYFSTIFKKYNGLSLSQYILKKRILLSIELLQNQEANVLDIAHMCGFNSSANFYKYFKSLTGKIPTDYRSNKL